MGLDAETSFASRRTFLKKMAAGGVAVGALYVAPEFTTARSTPAYASITDAATPPEVCRITGCLTADDEFGNEGPVQGQITVWTGSPGALERIGSSRTDLSGCFEVVIPEPGIYAIVAELNFGGGGGDDDVLTGFFTLIQTSGSTAGFFDLADCDNSIGTFYLPTDGTPGFDPDGGGGGGGGGG